MVKELSTYGRPEMAVEFKIIAIATVMYPLSTPCPSEVYRNKALSHGYMFTCLYYNYIVFIYMFMKNIYSMVNCAPLPWPLLIPAAPTLTKKL